MKPTECHLNRKCGGVHFFEFTSQGMNGSVCHLLSIGETEYELLKTVKYLHWLVHPVGRSKPEDKFFSHTNKRSGDQL
jgi:hypothetical protein